MVAFKDRTGDFTKKKHLYKFYKNGYTSRKPKYITSGQYLGSTGTLIAGNLSGSAGVSGNLAENAMSIFGNGDPNVGLNVTYKLESDPRRKMDIEGFSIRFGHGGGATGLGVMTSYDIKIFDYTIRRTTSGNTIKAFYKTTEIASATMTAGYTYLRMRESAGKFYIDRSTDGLTWTAWVNRTINKSTDLLRSTLTLEAILGAGGNGNVFANMYEIEAVDLHNNLLAVETQVLSDLQYSESINTPASSTTIELPYNPLAVPPHCDIGNFVEVYTNFYDDGVIRHEPILDHNSAPILDENSQQIYGVVLRGNVPEKASILKFSGYIDAVDYDYDNETILLTVVSHGETMANSLVRDGNISVPVISALVRDSSQPTTDRRQTFTITKMTKIDAVMLRVQLGAGGSSSVAIGRGVTTLATTNAKVWSGSLAEQDMIYDLPQSLYLEPGVYWLRELGGVNWFFSGLGGTYTGGNRQWVEDGRWVDLPNSDAYFALYSTQLQLSVQLSGRSPAVAKTIFDKSLALDYSPVYLEEAQDAGYDINIGLNLDSSKNAIAALYRQLPTGWFYHVDVGTGAMRIKDKNATPDHLLVFGRDFTEMKVTKDIDGIVNDVYYIGGALIENGPKLTVRSTDVESVSEYRQGLSIVSNEKVTRYDTAQLLSQNIINNNNKPRLTTEITLSAAKYNTETVRGGDVVKIVNGDKDVLGSTLVVANVRYAAGFVTVSLDSAPRNLSRTIDAINRQLENMQTANASTVV